MQQILLTENTLAKSIMEQLSRKSLSKFELERPKL